MKKVAFLCCLFCGLITQAIGATYNCKPQYIGDWGIWISNEYLYMSGDNFDDGIALICGHKGTDGCKHGTIVVVVGRLYIHKRTLNEGFRIYKCDTKGGSSWEDVLISELNECANTEGWHRIFSRNDFDIYVPRPFDFRTDTEGEDYAIVNEICKVAKKGSDSNDDPSPATSEAKKIDTKKDSETKPAQDTKQNQPAQTKSGNAEENEEDKWLEPCSEDDLKKVPHAKEGRYIYKTKDEIVCAATKCEEGYYVFRNENRESQGWCKYGPDPYATTNASETKPAQGASSSDASGTGATGADASGAGTIGTGTSGAATSGADTSAQNQPSGGTAGQVQSTTSKVQVLTQKIENAASQLVSISSEFKVSEWKNAEGKFNTARLASDSIAGVVLGTAGGLITSHVVKKNQVENGFQDIKCTIGGQSVANWGDEFSVGIQ